MLPQTVQKVAQNVDGMLLLAAALQQPELFQMIKKEFLPGAQVVRLRGEKLDGSDVVNYPFFDMLPQARGLVFGTMARVEGEVLQKVDLCRVEMGQVGLAAELPSGQHHYLICLQAFPGVSAKSIPVLSGDAFWFHGGQAVDFVNNSEADLYFLLLAITPNAPSTYVPEG